MFLSKPREVVPDFGKASFGRVPSAMRWRDGKSEFPALDQVDTRGIMKKSLEDTFDFLPTYAQNKKDVKRRMIEDAAKGENLAKDSKAHLGFLQKEVKKGKDKYPGTSFEERLRMADGKWRLKKGAGAEKRARKGEKEEGDRGSDGGKPPVALHDSEDDEDMPGAAMERPKQKARKRKEEGGRQVADRLSDYDSSDDGEEDALSEEDVGDAPERHKPGNAREAEDGVARKDIRKGIHTMAVGRDSRGRFVPI